ncbi:hypothetical protein [Herbaspirillum autotrophicum]|uniref:hypothetical protein n=1 Tax=Herbaspirillum autotrophicum TaxID=180195 RepID=UPI000AAE4689|nr:hypothetical protein [Herbaspirillum autotrophicum]
MAIWQFAVGLIPRAWAELEGNSPEMLYDDEGYSDMSTAWGPNQPNANLAALISQVLPPTESWSDAIKIWGDQAKSDIQVGYEGNNVESVMARIDTRHDTLWMCSKIVELARALDCCFFLLAARSIIMADVMALSSAVQHSEAARFSAAPRVYIEQLGAASSRES